jgi:O-antigen/teichoic acid export membrane protein
MDWTIIMKDISIVKNGLIYTLGNYFIKGLTFLTLPIFVRLLSPIDYGIYNMFIAYEGFFFVIIEFALNSSYRSAWYRFGTLKNGKDYYSYISTSMVVIIVSTILWIIFCLLNKSWLSALLNLNSLELILLVFYSAAMAILACFNAHIGLKSQYKTLIKLSCLNAIANIFLSIFLITTFYNSERYLGRMIGTTIPACLMAIYIICIFFKEASPGNFKEFLSWGLKYSIPIIPYGIGLVTLGQSDRIMIEKLVGTNAVGIYSFAYNIFALINVTAISLDNVWSPWLFKKMNQQNDEIIKKQSSRYIIMMLVLSCIIMLASVELVKLVGTKEYYESIYSVIPIVAGGYFSFLCTLPISVEYYLGKTKFIALGTIISASINVVLNYIFIPIWGYVAAAYTTLIAYFIYFLLHYLLTQVIFKTKVFNQKVFLFCSIITVSVVAISYLLIDFWYIRWILMFFIVICFLFFEEKEYRSLGKIIHHWRKQ